MRDLRRVIDSLRRFEREETKRLIKSELRPRVSLAPVNGFTQLPPERDEAREIAPVYSKLRRIRRVTVDVLRIKGLRRLVKRKSSRFIRTAT